MSFAEILLPEFDQEMASTRKMLACVPDGKFDYKPHEKSMPMGNLAGHVAEMATWVPTTLNTDRLDLTPDMMPTYPKTNAELLAALDKNVAEARAALEKATDEDVAKIWTLTWQGQTIFALPKSAVIRGMVMNHIIHHRAQLGVYLRLNNVAIPGMYGPSADEMASMQAAQA
ncbi:MAG TPA: DinB family protein [Bryobacteraceae bacterium]|nr:DinB family protein [Bryobacteraceae bacterium]